MLIEFRVRNFLSFRDEEALSLVAGSDTSLPSNVARPDSYRLLRTVAVYGANASGKSNLVKAVSYMRRFVKGSAGMEGEQLFGGFRPFALDAKCAEEPTLFEASFLSDGTRYQYGFTLLQGEVREEWLIAYPRGRAQRWFDRGTDGRTGEPTWKWGASFKGERTRLAGLTRKNALFLSVAAKFNHLQATPVYEWFDKYLRTVGAGERLYPVTADVLAREALPEHLHTWAKGEILALLADADLGITDVRVKRRRRRAEGISVGAVLTAKDFKEPPFDVELVHTNAETGYEVPLRLPEESDGTKRIFELAGPWLDAMARGYTVFVDELETHLHPLLTRKLVAWFQHPETISRGAQLVFATHDTTLLDPELLRRDQVWFTEKDRAGATHLYSLQDYKKHRARKGEALQKGYLSGRYGAIPVLGAFDIK
ncbi:MAG TPA: ATP-binding protein [Phycisphaerae bacterium]|nr:ATP-binding protein [Phycisphaerae bacterium]